MRSANATRAATSATNFVELARAVYRLNDERARLKKAINVPSGSRLVEEKSYKSFEREDPDQSH